jgi:hypothetical protein
MTDRFALLSYRTNNLGDEIQSIAARQFLPSVDLLVDRDDWTASQASPAGRFKIILNGWFTNSPEKWPPPDYLSPLMLSMHISRDMYRPTSKAPAAEALVTGESLAYLKRHEPIGGRDLWTVALLERHGVKSYFSGCIVLTLGDDATRSREDYTCAVDVDDEAFEFIKKSSQRPVLRISHHDAGGGTFDDRCTKAGRLLDIYARASCVVTTRLHCALPCVAFGTPVLLLGDSDYYRFTGLIDFVPHCAVAELKAGRAGFDLAVPPPPTGTHRQLRRSLIDSVQAFTGTGMRPYLPKPPDLSAALRSHTA